MVEDGPLNPTDVRLAAMDLLSRREHGSEELTNKLRRRFKRHENALNIIMAELERLIAEGLLSDERFAASMVRQLISRGLGPRRLDQELRSKGVRKAWQSCADAPELAVDWFERAEHVYLKKFADKPLPVDSAERQKERAKRARFMQYRGFEADHFLHLLDINHHY